MLSAICIDLDQSKILLSGNELTATYARNPCLTTLLADGC